MNKYIATVLFSISFSILCVGEISARENSNDYLIFSFTNVVEMAQRQSPLALAKKTERENKYWSYKSFTSNYKPQLVFDASLPGISKSNELITQPDGSKDSYSVFQSNSNAGLSASQLFGATGGSLFMNSNLNSSYNFLDSNSSYTTTPFEIGFMQPIFQFNQHRVDQKIERMNFEESKKNFYYEMEQISINATNMFFSLMIAQIARDIAQLNVQNNDTIYKIAKGRYELGKIAENEYLQIEIQYLKSQQDFEQAELEIKNASLALKNFLGIKDDRDVILLIPDVIQTINVDPNIALEKAKQHRPEMISYERQLLMANADVKKAKANSGFNADLAVSFGLSSSSNNIENVYDNFGNKQSLNVRMSVPIVDWGKTKAEKELAKANLELVEYNIDQQLVNFDQEIITHVNYFLQTKKQIFLANKTDVVAEKRYNITKNRYLIGKITITDMNIATQEKDQSKRNYIDALRNYWLAYFQLRKLTMYDFLFNKDIMPTNE